MTDSIKQFLKKVLFPTPGELLKNQIHVKIDGLNELKTSIQNNYQKDWRSLKVNNPDLYEIDLRDHLFHRLNSDRRTIIPWLHNTVKLKHKKILEIGCGTGPSTIALAEQGAAITAIEIDEGALEVAKDRARIFELNIDFRHVNANKIQEVFSPNDFDMVIFFASLQHMTLDERLTSLKQAWDILPKNGYMVLVEIPNRLWFIDDHTSYLPFFHWLPDELAFKYSKNSHRPNFNDLYSEISDEKMTHFLRRGRGVSFHELDVAIKPINNLKVASSLSTFEGIRYTLKKGWLNYRYKSLLKKIFPSIHPGFLDQYLYLIMQK